VRRAAVAAVLCSLGLVVSACGGGATAQDTAGGAALQAGITHQPYVVDPTPLTDTEGEPWSLVDDTRKDLTLVFFGYTNCPDICGIVMSSLASGLTRLDEADRERVDVVFVTTDPSRDTGPVLRSYLDRYDPSFIGLTGDLDTIAEVGLPLAVYVDQGEELPSGGRDLGAHSTQVSAITADDTSPLLWTDETSSAQFAADIHTLLADGVPEETP
jgi:protein SCO1/2